MYTLEHFLDYHHAQSSSGGPPPPETFFLLMETGEYLLQENGDKYFLESAP
jgi:hypothetical protein